MNVEHEHKLVDIGKNYQTGYREIECEECGYKTIAPIFIFTSDYAAMSCGVLDIRMITKTDSLRLPVFP